MVTSAKKDSQILVSDRSAALADNAPGVLVLRVAAAMVLLIDRNVGAVSGIGDGITSGGELVGREWFLVETRGRVVLCDERGG